MPASITTDLVVSSPKVAGRRMLMPESGPMPGSTPTTVPTRHPRNAYHNTPGCSATEKPSSRLSSVGISERHEPRLERRLQANRKQRVSEGSHADAERCRAQQRTAFDPVHQGKQQKRHGDEKPERLIEQNCCA